MLEQIIAALLLSCTSVSSFHFYEDELGTDYEVKHISDMVTEQYRDLPYPPFTKSDFLREVNHYRKYSPGDTVYKITEILSLHAMIEYLFSGEQKVITNNTFSALIAGGGTGNTVNILAESLRKRNATVHYVDLSSSSMKVAQKRARIRELDNIVWHNGRLEDLPKLTSEKFDFIESSGVVHHCSDPQKCLNTLSSMLKPHGGLALMVYSRIGRTGIYQIQDMMSIINENVLHREKEINNTYKVITDLEDFANRFSMNELDEAMKRGGSQIRRVTDLEMYDSFNHKQDNGGFMFTELDKFVRTADLHIVDHSAREDRMLLDPLRVQNEDLRNLFLSLDKLDRLTALEYFFGDHGKVDIFASKQPDSKARFQDSYVFLEFVPSRKLFDFLLETAEELSNSWDGGIDIPTKIVTINPDTKNADLLCELGCGKKVFIRVTPLYKRFLVAIENGEKTSVVIEDLATEHNNKSKEFRDFLEKQLKNFIEDMKKIETPVFLAHSRPKQINN